MGRRRVVAAVAATLALPVVVLGVEVQLARRGPAVDPPPAGRDGCVGCEGTGVPQRVVWLGDSTAAGVGVDRADDVLAQQVARLVGRPTEVRNLAVSGATLEDVLRDQLPQVGAADVVAVSIGANDVTHLTGAGTFRARYRRLLGGLPRGARVVVLGTPDMGSPPRLAQPLRAIAGRRGRTLAGVAREEARRAGATFVDVAGATGPAFRRDRSLFDDDRYHPSARGYAVWARAVADRWP